MRTRAWRYTGLSIEQFAKERGLIPQLEDTTTAIVRTQSLPLFY